MLHEGIPGHWTQVGLRRKQKLILFIDYLFLFQFHYPQTNHPCPELNLEKFSWPLLVPVFNSYVEVRDTHFAQLHKFIG